MAAAAVNRSLLILLILSKIASYCLGTFPSGVSENIHRYADQHFKRNWAQRVEEIRLPSNGKGAAFVYLPHEVILMKQALSKKEQIRLFSQFAPFITADGRHTDQSLCAEDSCVLFTSTMTDRKDEYLQNLGSTLFLETAEQLANIQQVNPGYIDQNLKLNLLENAPSFPAVHGVWYNENGYLRSHRDKTWNRGNKTSQTEWVLSISLGANARFTYHHPNVRERYQSTFVLVESGDVLLFNGAYLHHGVQVLENSIPKWWGEELGNLQGRLNLQYRVLTGTAWAPKDSKETKKPKNGKNKETPRPKDICSDVIDGSRPRRTNLDNRWLMRVEDKPSTDPDNRWLMRVEDKPSTDPDNRWLMRVEDKPSTDPDNRWLMRVEAKPDIYPDNRWLMRVEDKLLLSESLSAKCTKGGAKETAVCEIRFVNHSLLANASAGVRKPETVPWLPLIHESDHEPKENPGFLNEFERGPYLGFTKTLFTKFWCFNHTINNDHQIRAILALGGDANTTDVKKDFYEKLMLIQGLNIPVHSKKIVLSFQDSDVVESMYKSGLLVNPKNFILNGHHIFSKKEQEKITEKTTEALHFIQQADNVLFESMLQVVACIGYYKAAEKGHLGGTVSSAVGLIWLDPSKGGDWSIPFLAEQIVHEYVHTTLFIAEMVRGMYTDASLVPTSLVVSAIRRQKRGYDKSFHAAYVATGLVAFHAETGSIGRAAELAKYLNQSVHDLEKVQQETGILDNNGSQMLIHLKNFLRKARLM